MTEKQTYWVTADGVEFALITGADRRDQWAGLGWTETGEPTGDQFVWARCEGIEQPARFPVRALAEVWSLKGWAASEPPSPASPFNGDGGAPVLPVTSVEPLTAGTPAASESDSAKAADAAKTKAVEKTS